MLYPFISSFPALWEGQYSTSTSIVSLKYLSLAFGSLARARICSPLTDPAYHLLKKRYMYADDAPGSPEFHGSSCHYNSMRHLPLWLVSRSKVSFSLAQRESCSHLLQLGVQDFVTVLRLVRHCLLVGVWFRINASRCISLILIPAMPPLHLQPRPSPTPSPPSVFHFPCYTYFKTWGMAGVLVSWYWHFLRPCFLEVRTEAEEEKSLCF